VRKGVDVIPGYSRGNTAGCKNIVLACVVLFVAQPILAQQPEVQFLRAWQPAEGGPLAEVSGLTLAADGAVLMVERNRGALWRLVGDTVTSVELAGQGHPFTSKKTGGLAALGSGRMVVANTGNDTVALIDEQGRAWRVFGGGSGFFGGGSGDGELKNPEGLAFSVRKRLYVADGGNNRVAVYSEDGVFLHAIGGGRDAATALVHPVQVAVDDAERVYVLEDSGAGRLSVYSHSGSLLKRLAADAFPGTRGARWRALAVDRSGRVFLADAGNSNITELDWEQGQVRRRFGSPGRGRGQFNEVVALAISGRDLAVADSGNKKIEFFRVPELKIAAPEIERLASVRRQSALKLECERAYALEGGDLLCLDRRNSKVTRLDADGKPKFTFAGRLDRPQRAAVDARDIAIVDGDSVKIYSHDGKQRFAIGRGGSRDGEFDDIGGLHLADYIYVADTGNRRVQIFTRDGIFVNKLADGEKGPRRIARPTAVVTDALRNIYVADGESKTVQVFSAALEWRYALGRASQPYAAIHGLSVDSDDRLYVLAATERAKQVVDVFHGADREFSFAAYRSPQVEPSSAATLSIPLGGYDLALHDAENKEIAIYQFLQPPQRVGGIEVRGEPAMVRVAWRKSPERFVSGYRVYAAAERDGAYERLLETQAPEAALGADAANRLLYYRVSAYTNLEVEGETSLPVEDQFRSGYRDFEAGRYEAAVAALERAAKAAPDHAASVEYLGRSLLALGRYDAALAQFQDLARRPGSETVGRRLEARAIAAGGDTLGARSAVERAVAAGQADAATYMLCGELSLQLADPAGAVRCLETALSREPGNASVRALLGEAFVRLGAIDKGIAELDAAAAANPADAEIWRRGGRVLLGLGRHRDALARYARVLAIAPRDADALIASANAHLALAEFDQARTIALSLVGSPAEESMGQYVLGRIAMAQRQYENAVVSFARATKLDARHGAAWVGLADAHLAMKDEGKAREALAKAAALPGAGAEVFSRLAELESRGGRHAAALAALERAIAIAPGDFDLRLAQARTLAALERWQECGNAAREAQRLAPKNVEALLLAAEAAHRQGKNGEAIETLKRALALEPDSYQVHFKLGRSYTDNNLYNDAQTHLERAAQLDPRSDAPQLLLARVHLERRAFDAAIAALTQAVSLNPSDANRRELDAAYEQKKKAQSGTGARVVIEDLRLERMFASAHKQYATERLGQVKVRNDSADDYKGLRVSFFIKEYMDYPVTQEIAELKSKSSVEVPLHATFNSKVLNIDEDTRVLAVVTLAMADARDGSQEITQALTLYGKNAIIWSNGDMVGSFVTPRDDTLRNFVREAANRYGPPPQGALNRPLAQAAAVFNTLSAHGMRYQADPNTPYSRVKADQVDYVQFPRETLRLKSGDCDDLSVLLAAAYENLGIETALVDIPGHLFLMFRTGVKESERGLVSMQDDLLVVRNGEIWIPVESTLIAASFSEAWAEAARRYREADAAKQVKVLPLHQAWERFPPATLAPTTLSIEVPSGERVTRLIEREQRLLIARRLEREVLAYRQLLAVNPQDADAHLQIGTIYARNGVPDVAMREFEAILEQNPRHAAAHNNRANLYYSRGDFERALDAYRYAEELDPADGGIRVNAALAYYRLGKLSEAQAKFREASQLQKELSTQYRAFAKLLAN
jgi:tetratricopeptide (TPR) repeat protein/DNA-binding beta-propeller fold protein YncE